MTDKETVGPDIYERANEEARHGNREALEAAVQAAYERCAEIAENGASRNDIYSKSRRDAAADIRQAKEDAQ